MSIIDNKKIEMLRFTLPLILIVTLASASKERDFRHIEKNKMEVSWEYVGAEIIFSMKAPTKGWVAIGFNASNQLSGTYWVMGYVQNQIGEVKEHYTLEPGNYKTVEALGKEPVVVLTEANESSGYTELHFKLPVEPGHVYGKSLRHKTPYTLMMAYSQSDDYQHHSIMRTSIFVKL